jgi:hypothetical protein
MYGAEKLRPVPSPILYESSLSGVDLGLVFRQSVDIAGYAYFLGLRSFFSGIPDTPHTRNPTIRRIVLYYRYSVAGLRSDTSHLISI